MPQFDQGSFLNQVFWFFLVFLNSYFFVTYFFLPIISKNLKFRKKKIISNNNFLNNISLENNIQIHLFNDDIKTFLKNCDPSLINEDLTNKETSMSTTFFTNNVNSYSTPLLINFITSYLFFQKKNLIKYLNV